MKLFYSPGACSLSPHIVLCELGLPHKTEKVNLKTHTTEGGVDYYTINPKGYVPALQLDDGQLLTEGPAIVQYLADRKPEAHLLPPPGTVERARVHEWLTFIGTEIHKSFGALFRPDASDDWKSAARKAIESRFDFVDKTLADRDYLTGSQFTVADAYLFTIAGWAPHMEFDLARWPALAAYQKRVAGRQAVQEAMRAEGQLK